MTGAVRMSTPAPRAQLRSRSVTAQFTPQEAQTLLRCVREHFAMLLEQGRLGDQGLPAAASRLYSAMLEAGVTPERLE